MAKEKQNTSMNENKMASRKESPAAPTSMNNIPDKLLELILRHLTSPLWMIHAAATCRRWRRIFTDLRFSLNFFRLPPYVAGHYHLLPVPSGGRPTFVPSSPAMSIDRRHFSLDFLPAGGSKSWKLVDSNRSLLLLAKKKGGWMRHCFPELLVCEPLTRRHRLIPRPAEMKRHECLGLFLNGNCFNDNNMSRFNVTCVLYESYTGVSTEVGTIRSCVYWRGRRNIWSWKLGRSAAMDGIHLNLQGKDSLQFVGRAGATSFWWVKDERPLCIVHAQCTRCTLVILPEHIQRLCVDASAFRFVSGNDGRVHIACVEGEYLNVFVCNYLCDGSLEWMLENHLDLRMATRGLLGRKEYFRNMSTKIVTVSGRCIVLRPAEETWLFSVDVGTMRVEPWKIGSTRVDRAYSYELPWPPRFRACPCQCRRRGQGPCYEICTC
ncbi:hypothetical protein ACP70R_022924 [Stipagrostis hirtigluma subsp. patula]